MDQTPPFPTHPINILFLPSPPSLLLFLLMDSISSSSAEHLCYVRCNFCNTVLAVGVPFKRILETVTVKCGHCNNISFLSTRPVIHSHIPDFQMTLGIQQGSANDQYLRKGQSSSPASSAQNPEMVPKVHHVVKPPERKHRVPSAYNRFMKEEIKRIKTAQPNIPHREAFSMAAKNWAKSDAQPLSGSTSDNHRSTLKMTTIPHEKTLSFVIDELDAVKRTRGRN